MAKTEWGEEFDEQQPTIQGGIPVWGWFCGVGCLIVLLFGAGMTFFGWTMVSKATDEEAQWESVREVMPFDERPTGIEIPLGFTVFGNGQIQMNDVREDIDEEGRFSTVQLLRFSSSSSEQLEPLFNPGVLEGAAMTNERLGNATVQGRQVRALWFDPLGRAPLEGDARTAVRVDLSLDGRPAAVLELHKHPAGGALTESDLEAWLEPFDLWRRP